MMRRLVGVAVAVFMATSALMAIDAGVASAAAPAATGSISCAVTGLGKFSPKLTLAGVATPAVKFRFLEVSPTAGGCAGTVFASNSAGAITPVTVTGVKVKGTGHIQSLSPGNANSCPLFTSSATIGALTVTYTWTSTPAIAPTIVTYGLGAAPIVSGSPLDTISLQAAGSATSATGSFAPPATAPNTMRTNIPSLCAAGWGPFPTFTIGLGSSIALP